MYGSWINLMMLAAESQQVIWLRMMRLAACGASRARCGVAIGCCRTDLESDHYNCLPGDPHFSSPLGGEEGAQHVSVGKVRGSRFLQLIHRFPPLLPPSPSAPPS